MVAPAMYSQTRSESGERNEKSDGGSLVGFRNRMLIPAGHETSRLDMQHRHGAAVWNRLMQKQSADKSTLDE